MKKETRTVVYDDELRIEAYRFEGNFNRFIGLAPGLYRDIFSEKEETPDE